MARRKVVVSTGQLRIEATLNTDGTLCAREIERVRDDLADKLMAVARDVLFVGEPLSRMRVK